MDFVGLLVIQDEIPCFVHREPGTIGVVSALPLNMHLTESSGDGAKPSWRNPFATKSDAS